MGHERDMADRLRKAVASVPGVTVLGPGPGVETLPVVSFTVDGVPPALVAARLSAEHAIGVRHGCFCAHPYLIRLLGLSSEAVQRYRADVLAGDRRSIPGAVRVSACLSTTAADVQRLAGALAAVTSGDPAPVPYEQDVTTGDFHPVGGMPGAGGGSTVGAGCSLG